MSVCWIHELYIYIWIIYVYLWFINTHTCIYDSCIQHTLMYVFIHVCVFMNPSIYNSCIQHTLMYVYLWIINTYLYITHVIHELYIDICISMYMYSTHTHVDSVFNTHSAIYNSCIQHTLMYVCMDEYILKTHTHTHTHTLDEYILKPHVVMIVWCDISLFLPLSLFFSLFLLWFACVVANFTYVFSRHA